MGTCIDGSHGVVKLFELDGRSLKGRLQRTPSEPRMMRLFDVRGPSFVDPQVQAREPEVTGAVIVHGLPLRDYLRMRREQASFVEVAPYFDTWIAGSRIVNDATALEAAWKREAVRLRGTEHWASSEPLANKCSGDDWLPVDEGMDVSKEVADVASQGDTTEEGITLWKASTIAAGTIGILITENARTHNDEVQLGIRWLVGHPTVKGAGATLMAKADELHRQVKYRDSPMHVTASFSSVKWYESKGFANIGPAHCEDEGVECGCRVMQKQAPGER